MPAIQQLPKNTVGNDYIIGDVHGSSAFEKVLALLTKNDRLFIVGDLFDRGDLSPRIIFLIQDINKKMGQQVIFVVRGNHEDDFLATLEFLNNGKPNYKDQKGLFQGLRQLVRYLYNGGTWIFPGSKLFIDTVLKSKYTSLKSEYTSIVENIDELENINENINKNDTNLFKAHWLLKDLMRDIPTLNYGLLNLMREYIENLPYVLAVGDFLDWDRFVVVHADCYLLDQTLFIDYAGMENLSARAKKYFTHARDCADPEVPMIEDHTHPRNDGKQAVMYTGHTPRVDEHEILPFVNRAVSRVCLDVAAYALDQFLVVNHTKHTAQIVSVDGKVHKFLEQGRREIEKYLCKKLVPEKNSLSLTNAQGALFASPSSSKPIPIAIVSSEENADHPGAAA